MGEISERYKKRMEMATGPQGQVSRRRLGVIFLAVGVFVPVVALSDKHSSEDVVPIMMIFGMMFLAGLFMILMPTPMPTTALLRLAKSRNGVLSLSEISTTMDIDPALALKTLRHLQKIGVATQKWEEIRKNLWEFPDYVEFPISESLDIAKAHGGKVTLRDLVASGHSLDVAEKTLDLMSEKGLGQQDPTAGERVLVVQTG